MRLAAECDLSVVAEAEDCHSALDLARLLKPDVVLVDGDMPRLDGLAAAHALRAGCPHVSVIMLSMRDDIHTRRLAEQAGAAAFVVKAMPADHLLTAIRQVARPSRNVLTASTV
jgi:two-component system NarL family response regulator